MEDVTPYPAMRTRYDVLQRALAHVGQHYEPGCDVGLLYDEAVRTALGIQGEPHPETIKPLPAHLLHQVFGEIAQVAIAYREQGGPESNEAHISTQAYELTPPGVDWLRDKPRALTVAVAVVTYWMVSIQGGLAEATSDLATTEEVDWDGFLRGTGLH